jgi:hypothetical protein
MRRRYGKALQYYQVMADMAQEIVNSVVEKARQRLSNLDITAVPQTFETLAKEPSSRSYFTNADDHKPDIGNSRPSSYLRNRCPICFGGDVYERKPGMYVITVHPVYRAVSISNYIRRPDVQLSADACFTQSRLHDRHGIHDPPLGEPIPHTLFVSREECDGMKAYVEGKRCTRRPKNTREKGVAVSNEVLDLCGDSFKAADEKRRKSTKTRFDCTGIVAAVCRHGRVIWLINMSESGEQQYYILTLIDKLFKELPTDFTVGFLYDIACQLHRSMSKVFYITRSMLAI